MKRDFLIDTDTASDDAVALLMALRHPDIIVQAITIVAGNVPTQQAARNVLYTAGLCHSDVPVHLGADRPLHRVYEHAQWFHGRDGLGDMNYPPPARNPESEHAVDTLLRLSHRNPTLVTLGPLTNIAQAILKDPTFPTRIPRLVIMGGNPCCEGNVTPAAEYNIWVDPEAARIVFRAPFPQIDMAGWHLCRFDAVVTPAEMSRLAATSPIGRFMVDCNRVATAAILVQTGEIGIALPDPTAMAIAIDPTIAASSDHLVDISTDAYLTRGMTIVDRLNVAVDDRNRADWAGTRKVRVAWTINVPRFKSMLFDAARPCTGLFAAVRESLATLSTQRSHPT